MVSLSSRNLHRLLFGNFELPQSHRNCLFVYNSTSVWSLWQAYEQAKQIPAGEKSGAFGTEQVTHAYKAFRQISKR